MFLRRVCACAWRGSAYRRCQQRQRQQKQSVYTCVHCSCFCFCNTALLCFGGLCVPRKQLTSQKTAYPAALLLCMPQKKKTKKKHEIACHIYLFIYLLLVLCVNWQPYKYLFQGNPYTYATYVCVCMCEFSCGLLRVRRGKRRWPLFVSLLAYQTAQWSLWSICCCVWPEKFACHMCFICCWLLAACNMRVQLFGSGNRFGIYIFVVLHMRIWRVSTGLQMPAQEKYLCIF